MFSPTHNERDDQQQQQKKNQTQIFFSHICKLVPLQSRHQQQSFKTTLNATKFASSLRQVNFQRHQTICDRKRILPHTYIQVFIHIISIPIWAVAYTKPLLNK